MIDKEMASKMSVRDFWAGNIVASAVATAEGLGEYTKEERKQMFIEVSEIAYELADALGEVRDRIGN